VGDFGADFGLSLNHSALGDFNNVSHPLPPNPTVDLSGEPFPYAPDFTINFGMQYTFTLDNGSTLAPRFDYGYVAETQGELFDDPEFTIAAHGLLSLQLRWEMDQWYVVAWGTNVLDKEYVAAIQNTGSLYYAGARRLFGIRVGYNFE